MSIVGLAVFLLVLWLFVKMTAPGGPEPVLSAKDLLLPHSLDEDRRYSVRAELFSRAEWSFHSVLKHAVADDVFVLSKVRVADVLQPTPTRDRSQWQRAFNAISAKHFDFVLCSTRDGRPVAAIELDDSSHLRKDRMKRDMLLDGVCESAGFPLVRITARRSYEVGEVRKLLGNVLTSAN